MKINRLETHDRYQHFTKQSFSISECCQDLINQRPFGEHAFYIWAHTRTDDDGVTKRLIWQPRLTKPPVETNSMLFKAYPGTDHIKIIWNIPAPEMWGEYKKGNVTASEYVLESIRKYRDPDLRKELEAPENDDLTDPEIDAIYRNIARSARMKRIMEGRLLG